MRTRTLSTFTAVFVLISMLFFCFNEAAANTSRSQQPGTISRATYSFTATTARIDLNVNRYSNISMNRLISPDRIVIDIHNTVLSNNVKNTTTRNAFASSITYTRPSRNTTRVIITLRDYGRFSISKTRTGLQVNITKAPRPVQASRSDFNRQQTTPTPTPAQTSSSSPAPTQTATPAPSSTPAPAPSPSPASSPIPTDSSADESQNDINAPASGFETPLPSSVPDETQQDRRNEQSAVSQLSRQDVQYINKMGKVTFTLNKVKLTDGSDASIKYYEESYDEAGMRYIITYFTSLGDLETGVINIDDEYINSIEILKNELNGTTSIIFNAKDVFNYLVFSRPGMNATVITILKPALPGEKIVVIDPGHGGHDSGAIYFGLHEKHLNLDISLKLNELLKAQNIRTYLTRVDDTFISLYERAYIANNLNASLFISIHNNAHSNPDISGTMTLHFPQPSNAPPFNGRVFAQIVQQELLSSLGTVNRGIIQRSDLVVLRATKMPAVLAEIAFMSNINDSNNLKNEDFRTRGAKALCDALIKCLALMN